MGEKQNMKEEKDYDIKSIIKGIDDSIKILQTYKKNMIETIKQLEKMHK